MSVSAAFVTPRSQRTLSAAYAFHDAFFAPLGPEAPVLGVPLEVSIPELAWTALRVETDGTYRFSSMTLSSPPPAKPNLVVRVVAPGGQYENFETLLLTLPVPIPPAKVPERGDYLQFRPLWPSTRLRTPWGETAIRGSISSPTSQPVAGLQVEMWPGPSATPPAGTPYTRTNLRGDFLYRFPLLPTDPDPTQTVLVRIRLNGGLIPISPASLTIGFGQTLILPFERS